MSNIIFNKVLVAVDASEQSRRAVQKAAQLARCGVIGNVVLFNVYDSAQVDITKLHNQEKLDHLRAESLQILKEYAEVFTELEIEPKLKRAGGDPASLILDVVDNDEANETPYDLVIMGSRRLNKFQELTLGSVSDRVTRLIDIPVMIVK